MTGKFWISAIVMFVMTFALGWGVHGGLLHNDYMQMLSWMRKPEDTHALIPWMLAAHAVFAIGLSPSPAWQSSRRT
jgi:hypothetical protein